MEKIYVVIPNWNGADLIAECLNSLKKQTQKHKVIVVDNGSIDESIEIIETKFPDVELIKLPKNTGFSGGVNTGIRQALANGAEAIALFNNDAVADSKWLESLVLAMESRKDTGVVTCKLLRNDKKHFDSTGDYYSVYGMPFPRARNQKDTGQYEKPEEVFGASGGASLYSAEMLKQIGIFDEKFFAYYEDVDISFRAQLAGWKVFYEPKAVVYHHVSATSSKLGDFTRYHATKNFFMLYLKNMPGWLFWKYLPLFILQSARLCASSILKGGAVPFFKGFGKALLNTPAVLKDRHAIQTSRKVSISYIDSLLYKSRPPRIPKIS